MVLHLPLLTESVLFLLFLALVSSAFVSIFFFSSLACSSFTIVFATGLATLDDFAAGFEEKNVDIADLPVAILPVLDGASFFFGLSFFTGDFGFSFTIASDSFFSADVFTFFSLFAGTEPNNDDGFFVDVDGVSFGSFLIGFSGDTGKSGTELNNFN